jgi:hypothetical protein
MKKKRIKNSSQPRARRANYPPLPTAKTKKVQGVIMPKSKQAVIPTSTSQVYVRQPIKPKKKS